MIEKRSVAPLKDLTRLVKEGPGGEEAARDFSSQELWTGLTRVSAAWAMGALGQKVARMLSALPGFSDFKKMLDLGGGHGPSYSNPKMIEIR
ncbi:MAG: hypothetical protein K9N21_03935 [Deltaproteobacteria bacterium]|nr:hypothetical protein [Deltaproteobacteria bacterium]